jgi:hypothetical protein
VIGLPGVELSHVDTRTRHPLVKRPLQRADQMVGVMLIVDLNNDLSVVKLLQLG